MKGTNGPDSGDDLETYRIFLEIMLTTWDHDDMAYLHHKVMHPSYGKDLPENS